MTKVRVVDNSDLGKQAKVKNRHPRMIGNRGRKPQADIGDRITVAVAGLLRRQARLRREYIYRKSIEQRDQQIEEKKRKIRNVLETGDFVPPELRQEALNIHKKLGWDDKGADGVVNHCDDEYRWAGVNDPKIIITTSRDPSSRLRQFAQEMHLLIPNSQRINRGNCQETELMNAARANDITDVIVLNETRGNPDGLVVCHLPFGPTAYFTLSHAVLRHDISKESPLAPMSQAFPHLIFHNMTSALGRRVMSILKYLFPVPKDSSKRLVTFSNTGDVLSFR
ncbi:U3 small nucleolar ribonucleoprotein protein IMP4-like [Octopus sinensis]|uniref:U3 small nucleolar ribonucleoprotein protein IMP4-like n=1 Tax=Octopus sinensis TaxID=2607531 RepID=A0A7E6EJM7_9MOLL|nr:U3 small nucleolar ribonucleoprotein protein IMP4-like [Octopus sinensis]